MANKKISDLISVSSYNLGDTFEIVNNTTSRKVSLQQLLNIILNGDVSINVPQNALIINSDKSVKISNDLTVDNNIINEGIDRGIFTGLGIDYDGSQYIRLNPYVIKCGNNTYSNASSSNVVNLTGLTASTWYAVCIKESDGTVSNFALGSGWDNLTISGNQLNMSSIYSEVYNYCRDSRTSVYYRILGIYKTNSTPNNITLIYNLVNYPKSYALCTHSTGTNTILKGVETVLNYETIEVDINSEITVGAAWKFTAKKAKQININCNLYLTAATYSTVNDAEGLLFRVYDNSSVNIDVKAFYTRIVVAGTYFLSNKLDVTYFLNKNSYFNFLALVTPTANTVQAAASNVNWVIITEI